MVPRPTAVYTIIMYTTLYITHPSGGFPSSMGRPPRGRQCQTIRFRKAIGEIFSAPTCWTTILLRLCRCRAWKIGPQGGWDKHGRIRRYIYPYYCAPTLLVNGRWHHSCCPKLSLVWSLYYNQDIITSVGLQSHCGDKTLGIRVIITAGFCTVPHWKAWLFFEKCTHMLGHKSFGIWIGQFSQWYQGYVPGRLFL